jgi:hypothetical protein
LWLGFAEVKTEYSGPGWLMRNSETGEVFVMETLRKLSSMGRSKESKEAATIAVENQEEINNNASTVAPSPPRARVTDEDVEEVAGDDDGYDSAVEKIGTSSTPSVVEETVAAAPVATTMSFAQALRQKGAEEIETEEGNDDGNPIEDEEPSSSHSEEEEEDDEEILSRQVSIRAMPVAKLTTEEQEEDVDEDDGNNNPCVSSSFLSFGHFIF